MHLVDTLSVGGTERVAVNITNQLARQGHRSFLCTTRNDGPLSQLVSPQVGRLSLGRTRTVELGAVRRLVRFIQENEIRVLHAHGSSILTANLASRFRPFPKILWHDHYGTNERHERPVWLYRKLVKRAAGIAAVSRPLADWSLRRLRFPGNRVWCVPNFVEIPRPNAQSDMELPGKPGSRIVCVANLRPVKDHLTLLRAMERVVSRRPDAHLILVGGTSDLTCVNEIRQQIETSRLTENVTIMGIVDDVPRILAGSDIAVLSSTSEGLPVSLLEYGAAGLPVVVTDVGQCRAVIGGAGRIVPPASPDEMGAEIVGLLDDHAERSSLGRSFKQRVEHQFGADRIMDQWLDIYDTVLRSE
jgi:glycosyltransferase involved in cell wall biosynthesis